MLLIASFAAVLLSAPISANLQVQSSAGGFREFGEFLWDVGVEAASWTPYGRVLGGVSKLRKIDKLRKLRKPLPAAKPPARMTPPRMTPHEAGRFGVKLALAKLKRGYRILGQEIRMTGKGESIYTICDIVAQTDGRVICIEVKYGTGKFSASQLHYHRRKNASAFFSGNGAKAAGLVSEKPRTVWMKQMCFADGGSVDCKLE